MQHHFACTACGKCCTGMLPLTLDEALQHAHRFPLAMVWTVIKPGAASYAMAARLGTVVQIARRKSVAVQVIPMAYLPPQTSCPELTQEGLCGIHAVKPVRCRAMPFYAYKDEADQADMLLPRAGWACDISKAAPLVYQDGRILDRADFDAERQMLLDQVPIIKAYADRLAASAAGIVGKLEMLSKQPAGGRLALPFTGILPRLQGVDLKAFAAAQLPVLRRYAGLTADSRALTQFHQYYCDAAQRLAGILC
ncbi:YkgJ family cysteine cluster protein [Ferrovibrio sp.]|uniref:YkgJ family cysteine cluster protein n=1 Tax=Ferrovibrio sp. TaxID=1917215 RepID=UPI00311D4111